MTNLQTYGIQPSTGYLQPFIVVKPENESRTNTAVIARDRDLIAPIGPNQVMYWRAMLFFYTAAGAAGNANSQWTTPAAPLAGGLHFTFLDAAGAYIDAIGTGLANYNAAIFNYATGIAGDLFPVEFEGMVINGNNGGYFSFDWAQNVANLAPTVLLKGSRLECWFQ